ncbi:MAG: flagellar biosynthesis anti-sigma factor FlgM [Deltaproteobacteria bacterium RIFCSPLOWO2_12_FULL_38_8]|nr:MAG: flagellar biosynthesis anti-sigma factor FlgM [Deltaproteobacteria bacterium RIFCSPLOWO2_12_FULL_38_8]
MYFQQVYANDYFLIMSQKDDTKKGKPPLTLIKNLEKSFEGEKRAPQIDLKKVNRIRKAIQSGQYQIDYEKLAEKLLETEDLKNK